MIITNLIIMPAKKIFICAACTALLSMHLCLAAAFAAAPAASGERVAASTNVTAENMVYDSAAQKVTFSGKVKVTHPDFMLNSDRLTLFLADSAQKNAAQSNAGAVQRIIAESRVDIKLPEGRVATCNKATYTVASETLLMEGNPILREGNNQIKGDKMIFHLRENRNEVQGRVEVDFVPGEAAASDSAGSGLGGLLNR